MTATDILHASTLQTTLATLEAKRIQKHLRSVLKNLSNKDTSHLSKQLNGKRKETLRNLESYIEQAEFPLNETSYKRHPIFKDAHGHYCAMGYLLHMDGRDDIVDEIQACNNLVYIDDIAQPKYLSAFAALGLTKEEAAQVQPSYGFYPDPPTPAPIENEFINVIILVLFVLLHTFTFFFIKELNMTRAQKVLLFLSILSGALLITFIGLAIIHPS